MEEAMISILQEWERRATTTSHRPALELHRAVHGHFSCR